MAGQPYWGDGSVGASKWNTLRLGEWWLPGIVSVAKVVKAREVDKRKAPGKDGAKLKDKGYIPAPVEIHVRLLSAEHWAEWQRIRPNIDPRKPGRLRQPLEIEHPEPNSSGVVAVYVERIESGMPTAKAGKLEVIHCTEWFPVLKETKSSGETRRHIRTESSTPDDPVVNIF